MQRDEVFAILSRHKDEIAAFNVKSLALFGSVARNEAGPESDVDLLVEFEWPVGLFHFVRLKNYLEQALDCRVDLVTLDGLREPFRDKVRKEIIRVA